VFLTGCAELQDVIGSLQVKMLYQQHMSVYQTLHRYEHFKISDHFMMLYGISPYEPPSPLRFHPPLAVSTPSYLVPVVVHRSGLWAYQISLPMTTSYGAREGHCLPVKITGKRRTLCSESLSLLTA
jgi:hypothetical protein